MIRSIPLNKLVPSPRNVRRASDKQADLELKADIEARGLLQNLVVTRTPKPRGCFAVEAGGRRLQALQGLAAEGRIATTYEVSCFLLESGPAEAREASLAENFQRLAMNPADECLAFQSLIDQGLDAEGIARRFGLTVRFVEGRLRLANLAPPLFEALGSGDISLDIAKAYAVTPDQERQAQVFEQMGRGYGYAHPDSIRRMMIHSTASGADRRARLVGEEAYLAAGGRIERDLFADDAATRWLDVALLERLSAEKMEVLAAEAAAETGLAWVKPTLDGWVGYALTEGLRRVPAETPVLTDEETALVDRLEEEIDELASTLEHEEASEEERSEIEARIRELADQVDAIARKRPVIADDLIATSGAFLLLDEQGRPRLDTSYYTEILPDEGEAADGDGGSSSAKADGKEGKGAQFSQRLVDELAIQRRDILAAHVASDPSLALDLAIFLMVDREAGYSSEKPGSSLSAGPPSNPIVGFETPDAAATVALGKAAAELDRSWADGRTRAERFDAFRALSDHVRASWLCHAIARTLEASLNQDGPRRCSFHDHLGVLLGIDVAGWWRPTGANFFDRIPKSVALAALAEVGGAELAARYSGMKKAELAQSCERVFAGEVVGEAGVKEAALAWVPEVMRFQPISGPAEPDDAPDDAPGAKGGVDQVAPGSLTGDAATAEELEEAA